MKSERIFPEIMIKYIPHLEYGEEYDEKLFQIKNKTTGERVLLFATLFMMDTYKILPKGDIYEHYLSRNEYYFDECQILALPIQYFEYEVR